MMSENKPRECFEFLVTIRRGKDFENRKLIGSNSPFVEILMGSDIKKTKSIPNLENPIWNEALGFKFNKWEDMPENITLRVKDENVLLPNPILGEYNLKLDKQWLMNNYKQQPSYNVHDGFVNLESCEKGGLDFQVMFKYYGGSCDVSNDLSNKCSNQASSGSSSNEYSSNWNQSSAQKYTQVNKNEFEKKPEELSRRVQSDLNYGKNEMQYEKKGKETHVLPAIQVQEKPTIIEKEVEYHKPVEIKEKVIHQEKPIIVEQPIVKEKFEHYREKPEIQQSQEHVVKQSVHEQDVGNLDQQTLENLREQRQREFNDASPIVQHQKEHVQLEKEVHEKPTKVSEKEVLYQQPVEINKKYVEKVKENIHEDVKFHKEHVQQKLSPELRQENVQTFQEKEYLKENQARQVQNQ